MEAPIPNKFTFIKSFQLENKDKNYFFKIQAIDHLIEVIIFLENSSVYKGSINLEQIKN